MSCIENMHNRTRALNSEWLSRPTFWCCSEPSFLSIVCVCLVMPSMQRKKERKKCHQCYTQFSMTTLTTPQLPMLWHVIFNGNLVWLSISWHNFYTTTSYDIDHHNIAYLATHRSRRRRWVHVRAVTLGHWKRAANAATCNSRMSWDDWCWFVLHSMYYTACITQHDLAVVAQARKRGDIAAYWAYHRRKR